MSEFWNAKYNREDFLYGTEASQFIKEQLEKLASGKILFPAEGEGRNAVYAATKGWDVTAFDPSSVGQQKAIKLANSKNVFISYLLRGYENVDFANETFNAIGLSFSHMPPDLRKQMHAKYIQWLKPDGTIILELFSKEQLNYSSGGPKNIDMLLSQPELEEDFKSLSELNITVEITELNEGSGHQGNASVIRLIGKK
ncbi:MAG: class I SAM-dependent methyltransferase [Salinivirgaceae bacterium]|nr:class I SAM-dependent methyltransferase [Salinivirgaceae bacterium]